MKNKLVLWGNNAQEERVLIALELQPEGNKVNIFVFPEAVATEDFSKEMMDHWRNDKEVTFPEQHEKMERELSISESLLPEKLRVERTDVVQRAQTEWHFVVLSSKLHETYQSELEELKDKIGQLQEFDNSVWENLKGFWKKVQGQIRDRNLLREHGNNLRDLTNELFARMKNLRAKKDESQLSQFMAMLEEIEQRIAQNMRLQDIFEDLKSVQRKFREADFTREHRTQVWNRLDAAFKIVKEKRFGDRGDDRSPLQRLNRRFEGLLAAIDKMKRSIQRDENDLAFQNRKIASTDGQLEAQIRQAKIKMIEERIRSKEEKLKEMTSTQTELERRLEVEKQREAKRQEKKRLEQAKKEAEAKIAEKMRQEAAARVEDSEKLEKAAEAIAGKEEADDEPSAPAPEETTEAASPTADIAYSDIMGGVSTLVGVVNKRFAPSEKTDPETTPPAPEVVEETVETPAGEASSEEEKE